MATLQESEPAVFQETGFFRRAPSRFPTHVCAETRERYVLWSEIQEIFEDINLLYNENGKKIVLFMTDNDGKL